MIDPTAYAAASDRLGRATDAYHALIGARRIALKQGDEAWLADIREALPAAADEQRAASDALRVLVLGEAA